MAFNCRASAAGRTSQRRPASPAYRPKRWRHRFGDVGRLRAHGHVALEPGRGGARRTCGARERRGGGPGPAPSDRWRLERGPIGEGGPHVLGRLVRAEVLPGRPGPLDREEAGNGVDQPQVGLVPPQTPPLLRAVQTREVGEPAQHRFLELRQGGLVVLASGREQRPGHVGLRVSGKIAIWRTEGGRRRRRGSPRAPAPSPACRAPRSGRPPRP